MEAVATIGTHSFSRVNNKLQPMLKDEVKIAFDNATGNEIFARKYKVEISAEGKVWCIVKRCSTNLKDIYSLKKHCLGVHEISFSVRDKFIFNIKLEQRQIDVFDMSSEDAGSIKNLPESVSVSNDCVKVAGIIGGSSSSIADNGLQDILKDEVTNAFKNYMDDNSYGGKYKISMVGNKYECIIKGCDRSYNLERSLQNHCIDCHNIRLVITGEYIIAIEKEEQENALICIICYKKSKSSKALRDHYFKIHGLSSKLQDGLISPIMKTSNKLSKIYEPDTGKIQDNTNATKTTTDNMNSNRKRPHATAIHEEESNAKKAMLNPSESGYLQSLDTRSSISNSCEEDTTFSNRFLDGITADDSFVTPIAGNTASINTAFQFSATSQDIDDTELLELARELLQTNNDFKTALSGDASYSAASRDSYLQFSVTPKKV